ADRATHRQPRVSERTTPSNRRPSPETPLTRLNNPPMASSVPLTESRATCPLISLKDPFATGLLFCANTKVGIKSRSHLAIKATSFMAHLAEFKRIYKWPLTPAGFPSARCVRSGLDGIKLYRVLFQNCILFIARKSANVVGC